jgi:hypothetical protein
MKAEHQPHPCDRRDAFAPWRADHLYVGDSGQVLCGRCMGVESTYTPWAWSDLGRMAADRSLTVSGTWRPGRPGEWVRVEPLVLRCETDRYCRPASAGPDPEE